MPKQDYEYNDNVKQAKTILRRIQEHLRQSHLKMGSLHEKAESGFAEVIWHPESKLAALNYVMPRRKMALIPASYIDEALSTLKEHNRDARVYFAEGLYPPLFTRSLHELGLEVEREVPMLALQFEHLDHLINLPEGYSVRIADDQESVAVWWYIWRNAYYDVFTYGAEPLTLGRDMRGIYLKEQINLILYLSEVPVGAARITVDNGSANLAAMAIMREIRTPHLENAFRQCMIKAAFEAGCDMIFTAAGAAENVRQQLYSVGFRDAGSMIFYAHNNLKKDSSYREALAEPVLII